MKEASLATCKKQAATECFSWGIHRNKHGCLFHNNYTDDFFIRGVFMGLTINTNIPSLSSQRNLTKVTQEKDNAMERLASGVRINRAADDAAGLAISEKLKANIRGGIQAKRNAGDGISLIQTAEGGLGEVSNILIRLRELSIQAASDTVSDNERGFTNLEYQNLTEEIDRISQSTNYNGRTLLNGEGETLEFQVGILNSEANDRLKYSPQNSNVTTSALGIGGSTVSTKVDAQGNLEKIDSAINVVNASRAGLGALQNRLTSTISNLDVKVENLSAANSRIRDTDIAAETSELAKGNILSSSATAVLAQANMSQSGALKLIG